jgi:hypothetical protein
MKVTISTRTTTIETTQPGEVLNRETVQALTGRTEAWQTVERLALAAPVQEPEQPTEIDMTPDPLEPDFSYTDVSPEILASEYDLANMVPANTLAAE